MWIVSVGFSLVFVVIADLNYFAVHQATTEAVTEVSEHFGRAEAEVVKVRVKEWELLATVGFDWAEQRWFTKSLTRETELG